MKVSIICTAYNHEKYIADALDGMLMQKTDFDYEILVNDDCSMDNTAEIIKEYEIRYPGIIKAFYQDVNMYSRGLSVTSFLIEQASGEYIALCEGDDFWIDEFKLQKQIDYLDAHKECTLCFTNAFVQDQLCANSQYPLIPNLCRPSCFYKEGNRILTVGDQYKFSFVPTASLVYRKSSMVKMPDVFYHKCPAGDVKLRLYLTSMGYCYFMDEYTCMYRLNVSDSAMTKWSKATRSDNYVRALSFINMFNEFNDYTRGFYINELNQFINIHLDTMLINSFMYKFVKDKACRNRFKKLPLKNKLLICAVNVLPEKLYFALKKKYKIHRNK